MSPQSKEMPNLNLPPPVGGERPPAAASKETDGTGIAGRPEKGLAAAPETAPPPAAGPPAAAGPAIPVPPPPSAQSATGQADDTSTTQSAGPKVADDSDLIEKEWVNKAKQIVERTRDDPHRQSEELTVVKADYMQQQYGKTLKISK